MVKVWAQWFTYIDWGYIFWAKQRFTQTLFQYSASTLTVTQYPQVVQMQLNDIILWGPLKNTKTNHVS